MPDVHTNPGDRHPKPPFVEQEQQHPGLDQDMRPEPDFGYDTYEGHGRLIGKSALITGGDSGIGRAVALAFAREGADVAFSYLAAEEPDAERTEAVVREAGVRVLRSAGDVSDEMYCRNLVDRVADEFDGLDILVNNAAYQMTFDNFEAIPSDLLAHTFNTNILSMFWLCQAALPHMPRDGSIINVSSIQGYQPSPALLPYATTKGAIITFSKGLAQELAERGIRVNVVAPGPVWTPIIPASMSGEKTAHFGEGAPLGRPAQPAELAPSFVFLASQDASFITGEVLGVTGGSPLP